MQIQLVRHATLRVTYAGLTFLVDPMFSSQNEMPAVPNTPNQRPNPGVDLPMTVDEVLAGVDTVLVTHTHFDHLDEAAIRLLPKHLPLFCHPPDVEKLVQHGFEQVNAIEEVREWKGIELHRTGGRHGTGEIGKQMGAVSGFVLKKAGEPTLYIAGDTIWCDEVEQASSAHRPDVIVVFAGAAQFLVGDPITMTKEDIAQVAHTAADSCILVAHMETWNHCLLGRRELNDFLQEKQLAERVHVPQNGEINAYT